LDLPTFHTLQNTPQLAMDAIGEDLIEPIIDACEDRANIIRKLLASSKTQDIAVASDIVTHCNEVHRIINDFVQSIKDTIASSQQEQWKDMRFLTQTKRLFASAQQLLQHAQNNFLIEDASADIEQELNLTLHLLQSVQDLLPDNFFNPMVWPCCARYYYDPPSCRRLVSLPSMSALSISYASRAREAQTKVHAFQIRQSLLEARHRLRELRAYRQASLR
jgi:hypothetical protein